MTLKLYAWTQQHFFLYACQMAAKVAGVDVEVVVPNEEMKADKEFMAKKGSWNYPMLETEDGTMLYETGAICTYLLQKGGKTQWLGEGAFQTALVEQWKYFSLTTIGKDWISVILSVLGFSEDVERWNGALEALGKPMLYIEAHLAEKTNFAGKNYTLADILMFRVYFPLFSFVLGPDHRAKLPATTKWFEKISREDWVVSVAGKYWMCAEPWTLFGSNAQIKLDAPKEEAKKEEEDDECDDLFGSDDDDDDQDARMELKAKALAAKGQLKEKKAVVAKSMVLWEVKPLDDETNLDDLCKRIFNDISMDGLLWKEQYKKEPIAFGIFKLVIGATIEDDKVSTDDVQELIEAFDDMVQSVDILSFNKV